MCICCNSLIPSMHRIAWRGTEGVPRKFSCVLEAILLLFRVILPVLMHPWPKSRKEISSAYPKPFWDLTAWRRCASLVRSSYRVWQRWHEWEEVWGGDRAMRGYRRLRRIQKWAQRVGIAIWRHALLFMHPKRIKSTDEVYSIARWRREGGRKKRECRW